MRINFKNVDEILNIGEGRKLPVRVEYLPFLLLLLIIVFLFWTMMLKSRCWVMLTPGSNLGEPLNPANVSVSGLTDIPQKPARVSVGLLLS